MKYIPATCLLVTCVNTHTHNLLSFEHYQKSVKVKPTFESWHIASFKCWQSPIHLGYFHMTFLWRQTSCTTVKLVWKLSLSNCQVAFPSNHAWAMGCHSQLKSLKLCSQFYCSEISGWNWDLEFETESLKYDIAWRWCDSGQGLKHWRLKGDWDTAPPDSFCLCPTCFLTCN